MGPIIASAYRVIYYIKGKTSWEIRQLKFRREFQVSLNHLVVSRRVSEVSGSKMLQAGRQLI